MFKVVQVDKLVKINILIYIDSKQVGKERKDGSYDVCVIPTTRF